jgi:hypothetical protein
MCQEFLDNFGWIVTHIRFGSYGNTLEDHKDFFCIAEREGATKKLYCCSSQERIYGYTESIPGIGCYRIEDPARELTPESIEENMPAFKRVQHSDL